MPLTLSRAAIGGVASFVCFLTSGSAQVINWTSAQVGTLADNTFYGVTFDHLPDGRFVLGLRNTLRVQTTFGSPLSTEIPKNGVNFDPSFVSVSIDGDALLGTGGFGGPSFVHSFTTSGIVSSALTTLENTLQNYSAVYRHSSTPSHRGWLIGGTNAAGPKHNVTFVSLDGTKVGPITGALSASSGGVAVDNGGALFVGIYESFGGSPDNDVVLKFTSAQIDAAIAAVVNSAPTPLPRSESQYVYKFNGASSIAVDSLGRVWAAGFSFAHVQVYDPTTGAILVVQPNHGSTMGFGPNTYQVKSFAQGGLNYMAFLASDSWLTADSLVFHGYAQVHTLVIPNTIQSWSRFRFGSQVDDSDLKETVWGGNADPDRDGKSNLEEYAVGSNPNQSDSVLPVNVTGVGAGGLTLQFDRDPLNRDLAYVIEISGSLGTTSWTEIARSVDGEAAVASNGSQAVVTEQVEGARRRVTVITPVGGQSQFARMRILVDTP